MKFNDNLNDNWEIDLWQAIGEPDVTTLRNAIKNTKKSFDERLESHNMNISAGENTFFQVALFKILK